MQEEDSDGEEPPPTACARNPPHLGERAGYVYCVWEDYYFVTGCVYFFF